MRYVFVNQAYAKRVGMPIADIIGKRIVDVVGREIFERIAPAIASVLTGERTQIETELPFAKAGLRFLHSVYLPQKDEHTHEVLGFVAAITDVTERRRLEEQLRESGKRKDEFLAVLGHELRNPLAPIRYAVALLKSGVSPQKSQAAHSIIERQVTHMARLIDDLLDVSRITHNALELRLAPLDLREVITNAVDTARPLVSAVDHRLEVQLPTEPLPVMGDSVRLAQVLGNLLNNAAKYTDSGGRIEVAVRRLQDTVEISVRDNGIGLDPEFAARIFEFFVQGERSRARAPGGLGVGLALAQRLVQMHGGQLSASSAGLGLGSTFTVTLPLLVSEGSASVAEIERSRVSIGRRRRVLIVDDSVDATLALANVLQRSGYVTHVAHDGLAAVEMADLLRPEAIIFDVGVPKMNGQEAARWIRQQPWGRDTLLIAVSGERQEDDRHNKEAGFDLHFTKPVPEEALLKHLNDMGHGGRAAC
jgi:PAS domain S-box-containing protein